MSPGKGEAPKQEERPSSGILRLLSHLNLQFLLRIMSSSDEEVVRRHGRPGREQSPAGSEHSNAPVADNGMDLDNINGDDDDADLFGSDGSEGGLGDDEYEFWVNHWLQVWRLLIFSFSKPVNLSEHSTTNNWIPVMTRAEMIGLGIVWTMRIPGRGNLGIPSTSWTWV